MSVQSRWCHKKQHRALVCGLAFIASLIFPAIPAHSHTCANCFNQRERVSTKRVNLTGEPSVTTSICTSQRFVLIKHSLSSMKPSRCERSHTSHRLIIDGEGKYFLRQPIYSANTARLPNRRTFEHRKGLRITKFKKLLLSSCGIDWKEGKYGGTRYGF